MSHLKDHICEGVSVTCPFDKCDKKFSRKSSFTSHISRCHRGMNLSSMSKIMHLAQDVNYDVQVEGAVQLGNSSDVSSFMDVDDGVNETRCDIDESHFLSNVALFF